MQLIRFVLLALLVFSACDSENEKRQSYFQIRKVAANPDSATLVLPLKGKEEKVRLAGEVLLDMSDVAGASTMRAQEDRWLVRVEFNDAGRAKFERLASELKQQRLGFVLNGELVYAPHVMDKIPTGWAPVAFNLKQYEADSLAEAINLKNAANSK